MGKILVHEFITADGVIDDPSWSAGYTFTDAMNETVAGITRRCRAIVFGRVTYEAFEEPWSTRSSADDPHASFFNDTPKHIVTSTLSELTWRNSTILGPYDPDVIRKLKDEAEGDIFISASGTLVRALLADGLVDELNLFVYPLTLGQGSRLFPPDAPPLTMSLKAHQEFGNGVLHLTYQPLT
ncbi:dihydrofolate reductase family protein [Nonomuraea sp. B10E15]|uniref:dihydrofolate reductase family protein n=1 Tax=Nonomuraea sp. B10E15 TaxID=3153560 RepID=UPI00325C3596